jgi:hypothetical protein
MKKIFTIATPAFHGGADWLDKEHIDMIPLESSGRIIRISSIV